MVVPPLRRFTATDGFPARPAHPRHAHGSPRRVASCTPSCLSCRQHVHAAAAAMWQTHGVTCQGAVSICSRPHGSRLTSCRSSGRRRTAAPISSDFKTTTSMISRCRHVHAVCLHGCRVQLEAASLAVRGRQLDDLTRTGAVISCLHV